MQPALLIDEILREIFQFSSEYGSGTLSTLARSCRAWREPALDHLWMRLSSPVPLLQLISGIELVNGQYVLSTTPTHRDIICFHSYAQRVKHITHCRSVRIHPDIIPFLAAVDGVTVPRTNEILPSLRIARVSSPCDPFQQALGSSSQLRQLELDLGFKTKSPQVPIERACHFLEQVFLAAPELEKLSIRGSASIKMNSIVSSMPHLHTLSLRIGTSLTSETILAVARFPLLSELEIHPGHLDVDSLVGSLCDNQNTTFPSLRKLHIRAPATMIELFMNLTPTNTLQTLRIEAEDPAHLPIAWSPIFKLLCSKAPNTLQNLTLEHHIELDDLDTDDNTSGDPTLNIDDNNTMDNKPSTQISFNTLKDLSAIGGLRRLILDMTLPPCICDREMEILAGWWPGLEHLDLGSVSTTGCVGRQIHYPMTFQSLVVCAQKLPKLTSLILPANANIACATSSAAMDNIPTQHKLTRITLGHPSTPNSIQLAQDLYRLFPSLTEVDGLCEHEEQWGHTRAALQAHRLDQTL